MSAKKLEVLIHYSGKFCDAGALSKHVPCAMRVGEDGDQCALFGKQLAYLQDSRLTYWFRSLRCAPCLEAAK
jgi:hypothetical protein